jgi:hypothetical protein
MSRTPCPVSSSSASSARRSASARRHLLLTGATALVAALALFASPALLAAPDAATYQSARSHFQPALDGDNSAIDPAATQLKALSDADPADPVLRAYAGAATSMRARTTMLPWRRMGYAEDGLAQLDKALAQITPVHEAAPAGAVPLALETRYIAASSFLAMPDMFHRGARGEQLLTQVLTAPALATAAPEFQSTVWLYAGKRAAQAGRKDEAREWLAKVAASNTSRAATAQQLLKAL